MIIYALMLAQALFGNVYQLGDDKLTPELPNSAAEVFRDLCVRPFPNTDDFHAAVRAHADKFEQVDSDEIGMIGSDRKLRASPGELWRSTHYHLRYFPAGSLTSVVPQPQCHLTVRLPEAPDHAALAAQVSKLLGIAGPHVPPNNPPRVTYWDTGSEGNRWRILLKSEASERGNFMSLGLLNLPNP
jgi:hypothetical protein